MPPKKANASERATRAVDMSSEAIDRRLRELSQLYELGLEIRGAHWLGTLEEIANRDSAPESGLDAERQDARGT